MSKCLRCKVDILDDTMMCPLCRGVVEKSSVDGDRAGFYPDIYPTLKRMQFVRKLVVFSSVLIECVLILINYMTYNGIKWALVTGVGLAYACFTLIYSFQQNKSIQRKLLVQLVIAFFALVIVDATIGYKGWSITLAIPSAVMVVEVTLIVLMIINHKNWQNYLFASVMLCLISVIMLVLSLVGITEFNLLSIIAVAATGLLVLGTLVFGDKRAENELKRRFHI